MGKSKVAHLLVLLDLTKPDMAKNERGVGKEVRGLRG